MKRPEDGPTKRRGSGWLLPALLLAATGLLAAAVSTQEDLAKPAPVHADTDRVVEAMTETLGALLRDDAAAARRALDRVDAQLRELKAEEQVHFGRDIVSYSRAVKGTLNVARESSGAGNLERTFHEFISIQKTCRVCHDFARRQGLLDTTNE